MITQVPNWQSLTPQEILDYLLEGVATPNTRLWTFNGLVTTVSQDFAAKIELSLKLLAEANVPFAASSFNALSVGGLPLWEPHVDTLIDTLAAASQSLPEQLRWDEQTVTIAKSLGKTITPRWQSLGYGAEPTLQAIEVEQQDAKDELNGLVFDKLTILLSFNRSTESRISCRVQKSALHNNRVILGDVVEAFSSNTNTALPPHQAALVTAIQSALDAYEVALNG